METNPDAVMFSADTHAALHAVSILVWNLVYHGVLPAEPLADDLECAARLCGEAAAGRLHLMAHMTRRAAEMGDARPAHGPSSAPAPNPR